MTDQDFLQLDQADARNHALGQSQGESARLALLYKERHGTNIWGKSDASDHTATEVGGTVALGGWWLIAAGVIGAIVAFAYPVGVATVGLYGIPDQVANLDKIAVRHMIMAVSLALFVSGSVLVAAGAVQRELRRRK